MAYCPSCGTEMADNARFCSQCGAAMQGKPAAAQAAAPTPDAPQPASPAAATSAAEPLWTGWPSRKRHIPMLTLGLVILLAPLIAVAILRPLETPLTVGLLVVAGIGLLWGLWIASQMLLDPVRLRYWLTIDRLFIRRGILSRTTDQMELIRVDDIRVKQGLIDQMLGIGNVEIVAGTDRTDSDVALLGVADPMHVAEIIRENMRKLRQRRGMYIENV